MIQDVVTENTSCIGWVYLPPKHRNVVLNQKRDYNIE